MRLRTRLACLGAGLALATSAVVIPTVQDSSAAFTDAEHAAGQLQAAEIDGLTPGTCDTTNLLDTEATFTWQPPTGGVPPESYRWRVLNLVGGVIASGSVTTPQATVQLSGVGLLTSYPFQVQAVKGSWSGPWLEGFLFVTANLGPVVVIGDCGWQ